jgi:hypothetical protein
MENEIRSASPSPSYLWLLQYHSVWHRQIEIDPPLFSTETAAAGEQLHQGLPPVSQTNDAPFRWIVENLLLHIRGL